MPKTSSINTDGHKNYLNTLYHLRSLFKESVPEEALDNFNAKSRWSKVFSASLIPKEEPLYGQTLENIRESFDLEEKTRKQTGMETAARGVINDIVWFKPLARAIETAIDVDKAVKKTLTNLAFLNVQISPDNIFSRKLRTFLGVELPTDKKWNTTKVVHENIFKKEKFKTSLLKSIEDNYSDDLDTMIKIKEVVRGAERKFLIKAAAAVRKINLSEVENNYFTIKLQDFRGDDQRWEENVKLFKKEFGLLDEDES